jgi:hypothetical protein
MDSVRCSCDSSVLLRSGGETVERSEASTGRAAIADLLETEEAKGLLESGRLTGSLSAEEIALALNELELDASQLDDFFSALEELKIEVVNAAQASEPAELPVQVDARS